MTAILLNFMIVVMPLLAVTNLAGSEIDEIWNRVSTKHDETEARNAQLDEDANFFQKTWANIDNAVEGAVDVAAVSIGWLWVFTQGVLPFTGNAAAIATRLSGGANTIETVIYIGINFFRSTLIALMAFELFLIWRNRKTGA